MATKESTGHHLECSKCLNRFQDPKLLSCLHSFCLACLQELQQHADLSQKNALCPICRKEITTQNVVDLPSNLTLSALVEEVAVQEQLREGQGSGVKCQACVEQNQAVSRCADCDHFLCQDCQRAHQRLTIMKSHTIHTVAQLKSGEVVYRSKLRDFVPKCGKHTDQSLSIYCSTCQRLTCTTCSILHHKGTEHSLSDLSEAFDKCKQEVMQQIAAVEAIKVGFSEAASETGESLQTLQATFDETNQKITDEANKEVAKIRDKEQRKKQELKQIYQERVKIFEAAETANKEKVAKLDRKIDSTNQMIAQASCYEVLGIKQTLLQNLKELQRTITEPVKLSQELKAVEFEKGVKPLGRMAAEAEHHLESKAAQFTPPKAPNRSHVQQCPNTEIKDTVEVLLEEPGSASLKDVGRKGQVGKNQLAEKPDTEQKSSKCSDQWSFGILVPRDQPKSESKLTVEESHQPEGSQQEEHWILAGKIERLGSDQIKFRSPYDVAVFSNNELVIADTEHKKLIQSSLTANPWSDVSSILEINGLTDPLHVSVNKDDQLIVLDSHTCTVNIFNMNYKLLRQFIPGKWTNGEPTCLSVDECNQIAVGFRNQKMVFLHSSDGSLIRSLHATMIDSYLATFKQRFIYTNYWNKMLYSQDYNGDIVFSVNIPSNSPSYWGPNGVCCDKRGNIYVAVRGFASSYEIQRFSPDGANLGSVITQRSMPRGISLASDDHCLVVATKCSVSIYRRVTHI
ncbi:E3 ubiquitin-protein ligase TRIM71-like isoform X1 [Acanthaster planci]|uniref:E3 ubiquitin-protein ligase TRIM71-like isoform X1 n=1 Tax=Acanthaster planci TaxID=133434 RepID=A0A8B7YSE8_ACAPL|nr:E3 ubiquitin-protein ligase TRIM71-like isoform X1 [Acanthaster planci]